jgi:hypothetical protein
MLMPEPFNERFTGYLNTEGEPVQRTLCKMTEGEVIAAIVSHALKPTDLNVRTRPT